MNINFRLTKHWYVGKLCIEFQSIILLCDLFQQVFHVFEAIELVVRRYLNFASLQAFELNSDLKQTILSEVLTCEAVMHHWEIIAKDIPVKLEEYSICLLRAVCVRVRVTNLSIKNFACTIVK